MEDHPFTFFDEPEEHGISDLIRQFPVIQEDTTFPIENHTQTMMMHDFYREMVRELNGLKEQFKNLGNEYGFAPWMTSGPFIRKGRFGFYCQLSEQIDRIVAKIEHFGETMGYQSEETSSSIFIQPPSDGRYIGIDEDTSAIISTNAISVYDSNEQFIL